MDDNPTPGLTQDQIFENIRLHKEVLGSVKMQPWNMRRKLKLVMQAKSYVKRHEGALQERLTQSHSIKDMMARWNIYLIKVRLFSEDPDFLSTLGAQVFVLAEMATLRKRNG